MTVAVEDAVNFHTLLLDDKQDQYAEAKGKSQLPLGICKENLVEKSDGVDPTLLRNAPPMIRSSTATDINEPTLVDQGIDFLIQDLRFKLKYKLLSSTIF